MPSGSPFLAIISHADGLTVHFFKYSLLFLLLLFDLSPQSSQVPGPVFLDRAASPSFLFVSSFPPVPSNVTPLVNADLEHTAALSFVHFFFLCLPSPPGHDDTATSSETLIFSMVAPDDPFFVLFAACLRGGGGEGSREKRMAAQE